RRPNYISARASRSADLKIHVDPVGWQGFYLEVNLRPDRDGSTRLEEFAELSPLVDLSRLQGQTEGRVSEMYSIRRAATLPAGLKSDRTSPGQTGQVKRRTRN